MKRLMDLILSSLLIMMLSPFFLLISFFIVIDSKGGVFFLQERIGLNRKRFKIIKFRTMVKNAEALGSGVFVNRNDSRITKIGFFLRKFSLDELPQIVNVIKGDMSFVGPRPPVVFHPYPIDDYPSDYLNRFSVKPGITGLAQISGRTNITWEERFSFDLEYVKNYSFVLDVHIIFLTVLRVLGSNEVYPTEKYIKNNHKI